MNEKYSSNSLKEEIDKINVPKDKLDKAVKIGIQKGRKKRLGLNKKISYLTGVAILFIALFVGSAFIFSPIGAIASKIPYLSAIFESKRLDELILSNLEDKGYKIGGVSVSNSLEKEVEVRVQGTTSYYNSVKKDIEQVVRDILDSKQYDNYSLNVSKENIKELQLTENEKNTISTLKGQISDKLTQSNYNFKSIEVAPWEKVIYINVKGSDTYYQNVKSDIEEITKNIMEDNNYKGYVVMVNKEQKSLIKKEDNDIIGSKIVPTISEGLSSKSKYNVTSVSYKKDPLTFIIKTSNMSTDKNAKDLGIEIDNEIKSLLNSNEVASSIKDKKYEVIVYSKDNKKIN
ncbi:DUF4030 domain-containing protein [Priestia megaterium]|uniref:DUF4030 domain-containing protein n=1 Tax=Priestia megaterium TaxID=1404 RepID=UPI00221F91DE|nr:DUF4030 domain-containing protein [Priestia megaterium]